MFKHGTRSGYSNKCRCIKCSEANRLHIVKYRIANPDKEKANVSRWAKANRNKKNANHASRRARKLDQFDEYVDRMIVWTRDGGICHICNLPADPNDWHLEHKVPLSMGGRHSYENTGVSHPACNWSKGAKILH